MLLLTFYRDIGTVELLGHEVYSWRQMTDGLSAITVNVRITIPSLFFAKIFTYYSCLIWLFLVLIFCTCFSISAIFSIVIFCYYSLNFVYLIRSELIWSSSWAVRGCRADGRTDWREAMKEGLIRVVWLQMFLRSVCLKAVPAVFSGLYPIFGFLRDFVNLWS